MFDADIMGLTYLQNTLNKSYKILQEGNRTLGVLARSI